MLKILSAVIEKVVEGDRDRVVVKRAEERLGLCSCGFGRQVERSSLYNAEPTRIIGNVGSIRVEARAGSLTATGSISGRATAALFRHDPVSVTMS